MITIEDGIEKPKWYMEVVSGTTGANGRFSATLTYEPKSIDRVFLFHGHIGFFVKVYSLSEKTIDIMLAKVMYDKADSSTGVEATGDTGAPEPHGHTLSYTSTDATIYPKRSFGATVSVFYEVK